MKGDADAGPPTFTAETFAATLDCACRVQRYRPERASDPEPGEVYQPAGLRCLGLRLLDPPSDHSGGLGGQCGEFPRTPYLIAAPPETPGGRVNWVDNDGKEGSPGGELMPP